ncbi:MAG: NAD(P)/FAD-dependent oxidoreductase [Firmicutes bacterium]|nr:NAD(P)/FAD-dependent oxidoreductase [Bacillota bacterium]
MAKRVVIAGAGYGGVACAQHLQKHTRPDECEITVVNKLPYHSMQTQLHEIAAWSREPDEIVVPLEYLFDTRRVQIGVDEIDHVDLENRQLVVREGKPIAYDVLILGVGSVPEYFNIEGLAEYAMTLNSVQNAVKVRKAIYHALEMARENPDDPLWSTILIGGAGLTGVELAGELADNLPDLCERVGISPSKIRIVVVEAMQTVLPGMDPDLVSHAKQYLEEKGIQIYTGVPIARASTDLLELGDGTQLRSKTIIWTGGVRSNPILEASGFECAARGRAKVNEFLQAEGHEEVFVIGDCALTIGENGRPMPPTAQLAEQEGDWVGANVIRLLRHEALQSFHPDIVATVGSVGRHLGIALFKGGRKHFGGFAHFLKSGVNWQYWLRIGGLGFLFHQWFHRHWQQPLPLESTETEALQEVQA